MREVLKVERNARLPVSRLKTEILGAMLTIEHRLANPSVRPVPPSTGANGDSHNAFVGGLIMDVILGPAISALFVPMVSELLENFMNYLADTLPELDYGAGFEAAVEVYDNEVTTELSTAYNSAAAAAEMARYAHELKLYEAEQAMAERLRARLAHYETQLEQLDILEEDGVEYAEITERDNVVEHSVAPEFARKAIDYRHLLQRRPEAGFSFGI